MMASMTRGESWFCPGLGSREMVALTSSEEDQKTPVRYRAIREPQPLERGSALAFMLRMWVR